MFDIQYVKSTARATDRTCDVQLASRTVTVMQSLLGAREVDGLARAVRVIHTHDDLFNIPHVTVRGYNSAVRNRWDTTGSQPSDTGGFVHTGKPVPSPFCIDNDVLLLRQVDRKLGGGGDGLMVCPSFLLSRILHEFALCGIFVFRVVAIYGLRMRTLRHRQNIMVLLFVFYLLITFA